VLAVMAVCMEVRVASCDKIRSDSALTVDSSSCGSEAEACFCVLLGRMLSDSWMVWVRSMISGRVSPASPRW
jgi:hypothetical protein